MAEISMVQMTGPAAAPGASTGKTQDSLATDFSDLLRDKGQPTLNGDKKTNVKRQEQEQNQTSKPVDQTPAQDDERQEVKEPASSLEDMEEGLSVLAGMMLQTQGAEIEPVIETEEQAQPEMEIPTVEGTETILPQDGQMTVETQAAEVQTSVPVQEAASQSQPQSREPVQTQEPAAKEPLQSAEDSVKPVEPQTVSQSQEAAKQEHQATANERQETGENIVVEEESKAAEAKEQVTAQGTAAEQFQTRFAQEEGEVSESSTVKTSETTMPRDVAEALATRMPTTDGELTLELEPASLGKIIIKVAFEGGKAVMSLMADNTRTLAILSQRAGEMAQILEEKTGQQTVIYTPENQSFQEELPERGGEEGRQRQRDEQEQNRHKESESFMQQLRLGLVG